MITYPQFRGVQCTEVNVQLQNILTRLDLDFFFEISVLNSAIAELIGYVGKLTTFKYNIYDNDIQLVRFITLSTNVFLRKRWNKW